MGYGISIRDMVYRSGYLTYRYGHPGYRYGIGANDMGDDSIDVVILEIDMGYLVTLPERVDFISPEEEAAEVAVVREFRLVTFVPWSKGLHSALHYSDTL